MVKGAACNDKNSPKSCLGKRATPSRMEPCKGCSCCHCKLEPKGASASRNTCSACSTQAGKQQQLLCCIPAHLWMRRSKLWSSGIGCSCCHCKLGTEGASASRNTCSACSPQAGQQQQLALLHTNILVNVEKQIVELRCRLRWWPLQSISLQGTRTQSLRHQHRSAP